MGVDSTVLSRLGRQQVGQIAVGRATMRTATFVEGEVRVRFQIIGNARIENVGKYQSCMVSKLPIIWKQTVRLRSRLQRVGGDAATRGGCAQFCAILCA